MGVRTIDGRELRADLVLVAAGAWTPALLPHLGDVMWATGQPVVHFRVEDPAAWQAPRFPVWAADISRSGWYGFPALDDGTLKIANHGVGRRVHADDPRRVLPAEEARFRAFVRDHLPALAGAPIIATRLCLYCDTFDGDFWIAHDPGARRLDRGRRGQRTRVQVRAGSRRADCRRGRGEAECVGAALSLADERARCERGGARHGAARIEQGDAAIACGAGRWRQDNRRLPSTLIAVDDAPIATTRAPPGRPGACYQHARLGVPTACVGQATQDGLGVSGCILKRVMKP